MNKDIIHSLSLYLRRFRFELSGFWLVSAVLSWQLATNPPGTALNQLKALELLLLAVVVARLALAETIFKTTGGWQSRPLSRNAVAWARCWMFGIIVGIPLLLRLVVWWKTVPLTGSLRYEILRNDVCGLVLFVGAFFLLAHLFSKLIERERKGLALFFVLPLAVGGALAWLGVGMRGWQAITHESLDDYGVPSGVRAAFPADTTFIGLIKGSRMNDVAVREVMRIPLKEGKSVTKDGITVAIRELSMEDRLMVDVSESFPAKTLAGGLPDRTYVVRYGDGSIAANENGTTDHWGFKALLYYSQQSARISYFRSPRDYPWNERSWEQLLDGAELILFQITDQPFEMEADDRELVRETIDETRVRSGLMMLHPQAADFSSGRLEEIIAVREDVVELLLRWPVWSDDALNKLVLPVLEKRAEERHRAALEERFLADPRLAGFLIGKGWGDKVMPELILHVKEGRPLRSQELVMVASLKDSALANHLEEAFLRLAGKNEALAEVLRQHPGVDWSALVRRGWEQAKTSYPLFTQWWTFANWAAREGDVSALRRMAVEAANGKKWEREQLVEIVDSGGEDPVRWLARNHERMRYDPATKRFTAVR